MNIVCDMDDTIANFTLGMAEELELDFETINAKCIDIYEYIFEENDFFQKLEPIDGAIEGVKKLMKLPNAEVFIVSRIPRGGYSSAYDKYTWLEKYLPEIDINHIFFTGNMRSILANDMFRGGILIDDNFENCKTARDYLLFKSPHNLEVIKTIPEENVAFDWNDVYNKVLAKSYFEYRYIRREPQYVY